ncbi:glycosyl hydrolase 53 family protein [Enterococcus sp. S22(2020)]|nr:glycosyl hydrolase 53 family protein [Enterococcus sp. S23]MCA5017266.1 glycosyl hydrolase 53 family protein [Enterococcus sp. S22(2020)]
MKKKMVSWLFSVFLLVLTFTFGSMVVRAEFISGADISILADMEKSGGKYYENGTQKDALQILKNNGVNYVRLRLWNNPYDSAGNSYGAGTNDLATTISLAKRAKALNLKVLLDFHYSDFWVDPGKQNVPKAWASYSFDQMNTAVYDYTKTVLTQMKSAGAFPDMVQIGNELNSGMLWPYGKSWGQGGGEFDRLATFLNSGIKAVKDTQTSYTPIMLHVADGGDTSLFQWWFDEITARKVNYDLIGISYYPYWHGSMANLQHTMDTISQRYAKDVVVVETAYGHTTNNADNKTNAFTSVEAATAGYEASSNGQYRYLTDLITAIKEVPNNKGTGFFYWEPLWYNGAVSWATQAGMNYLGVTDETGNEWDNQAMFDFNGNALPSLKAFSVGNSAASVNYIDNPSFELNGYTNTPANWTNWYGTGAAVGTIKTEDTDFAGKYKLSFWSSNAYEASTYQKRTGLQNGTYTLSAYVMSGGSFTTSQMYIKNYGGTELTVPTAGKSTWTRIEIGNIKVINGTAEIGFYTKASANAWVNIDRVILTKNP